MKQTFYRTHVFASTQVEGIHFWKDAESQVPEVGFLKFPHRHMFHIKVLAEVSHDDRDIEIINLKRHIEEYLYSKYSSMPVRVCIFGEMSCEMIAKDIADKFDLAQCSVTEDGENGAIVTRTIIDIPTA